jgi:hypothetical protein
VDQILEIFENHKYSQNASLLSQSERISNFPFYLEKANNFNHEIKESMKKIRFMGSETISM